MLFATPSSWSVYPPSSRPWPGFRLRSCSSRRRAAASLKSAWSTARSVRSLVAFRSTPFIILSVALLPLTRLLIGTMIGVWAADRAAQHRAAIPFLARVAEVSLREVDRGLIEAAQAMGAQRRHIIWHVLLPEALPGILGGFTITVVAMIGSSAMAGAVGAGGLGDLAIRYGYQRFDTTVMVTVIALLIVIVTVVQFVGDRFVRRLAQRA